MKTRALFLVLLATFVLWTTTAEAQQRSLPQARAQKLRKGINTSHWFAQVSDPRGYVPAHLESHTTAEDIALIRRMGFDHIRLSVDPDPLWRRGRADELPEEYLKLLERAVDGILAEGLAVVIDIHPSGEFKRKLVADNGHVEQFADFWRGLAARFRTRDAERVFFELLNEPEFEDPYRWMGVQAKLVAAVRQAAPEHTIIVSGHRWSGVDEVLFLEPVADSNVIYNFHFYEPHFFTHQGATWGSNYWHYVKGGEVVYPSDPASTRQLAAQMPSDLTRMWAVRYGSERWNAERIRSEVAQVAAWARARNLALTCNEFGVYRAYTDPQQRAAWLTDLRRALEEHGIGWTMWDYAGGFAVVNKKDGKAFPDELTLRALGLKGE